MGLWDMVKGWVTPTSKSQIRSKQKRIARIEVKEMRVEERIAKLKEQKSKAKSASDKLKIDAKIRNEQHDLQRLELEEQAHAVQLMNGLNAQIATLAKALDGFDKMVLQYKEDFEPLLRSMNDIRLKVRPEQHLTDTRRVQSLLGLAITGDKKKALEGSGRKVANIAAAEKIIEDDINKFTGAMHHLGTAQVEMRKLREKMEVADRKYDIVNDLIYEILGELKMLGHDFVPKMAAVRQIGGQALAKGLKFQGPFEQTIR